MRVLVCGSRYWLDRALVWQVLDEVDPDVVIEGKARGADTFAGEWAVGHHKSLMAFQADWKRYGRGAGLIRNQEMLDIGRPDLVVAFHDNIAGSGTAHMVRIAEDAGVVTRVVTHRL